MANSTLLTKAPPAPRSLPKSAQREWNAIAQILAGYGCRISRVHYHTVWNVAAPSEQLCRAFSLSWTQQHGWYFEAVPPERDRFSRVLVELVNGAIAAFGGSK